VSHTRPIIDVRQTRQKILLLNIADAVQVLLRIEEGIRVRRNGYRACYTRQDLLRFVVRLGLLRCDWRAQR
jgi:hypothetical protein